MTTVIQTSSNLKNNSLADLLTVVVTSVLEIRTEYVENKEIYEHLWESDFNLPIVTLGGSGSVHLSYDEMRTGARISIWDRFESPRILEVVKGMICTLEEFKYTMSRIKEKGGTGNV